MKRNHVHRGGFTLAESLAVILILALLTVAGTAGVSGVMASRMGMIQTADAEILGSTILQTVADELRYGQNIQVGDVETIDGNEVGKTVTLDSLVYGAQTTIALDEQGKLIYNSGKQFFGEKAYSGLKIDALTYAVTGSQIEISIAIGNDSGVLWDGEVQVRPLNSAP